MMNAKEFAQLIPLLQSRVNNAITAGVHHAAVIITEEAKSQIGHPQSGWPPLADTTEKTKSAEGFATPDPLLRTGSLRDSIKYEAVGHHATVSSDHTEAAIHEHGSDKVPPRPFISSAAMKKLPEIAIDMTARVRQAFTTKD